MSAPYAPEAARGYGSTIPRSASSGRGGRGDQRARPRLSRRRPMTAGEELYKLVAELYPICRSITGDGVRRTLEIVDREIGLEVPRSPPAPRCSTGRCRGSGTSATPGWRRRRRAGDRLPGQQPPPGQLQRAGAGDHAPGRAQGAPVHPARPPRLGALPHLLLRRALGLLRQPAPGRQPARGRLRGLRRHHPGRRPPHLRRAPGRGRDRRRGPGQLPRLPPVAGQRQPLGDRRGQPPGQAGRAGPRPRYSYRFLFIPGTIGSITWLARNEDRVGRIRHGLVLSGVGDPGGFTYKRSRRGDAEIDRAVAHVLAAPAGPTGWSTSRPTATTSASSARPASTCPSAASAAPVRHLPRVPHLGRRPRPGRPGPAPGEPRGVLGGRRCAGGQPALPEPEPQGSRSSAGAGCTGRSAGAATPRSARWPCCGS